MMKSPVMSRVTYCKRSSTCPGCIQVVHLSAGPFVCQQIPDNGTQFRTELHSVEKPVELHVNDAQPGFDPFAAR